MQLGEILIEQGMLTAGQVEAVLEAQCRTGGAFGQLAERMFGLSMSDVEKAWSVQYANQTHSLMIEDLVPEPSVLGIVDRRQAWQFRVLPVRREDTELVLVTTQEHLTRAMRFALRHIPEPCFFLLAESDSLGIALSEHYPMGGMSARFIRGRGFDWTQLDEAA